MEIVNCLLIGFNLGSYSLGTRSPNHYIYSIANGKSLKVLYTHPKNLDKTLEIFHFPEIVQLVSDSTPITQSSINPQQNKKQKPTTFGLIIYKHYTHTHTHTHTHTLFLIPPDQHQKQNEKKPLDLASVLISFSYSRNTKKNSSTRQIKLTRVANSRRVIHKSCMTRCFPRVPVFQPKQ